MATMNDNYLKYQSIIQRNQWELQALQYREQLLRTDEKFSVPENLNRFEYQIHSQCGEDGIINEIFRRIGTFNRCFVELGAGNGLQNNTTALLLDNWTGAWIEADPENLTIIREKFSSLIRKYRLSLSESFITAENIEALLETCNVPDEFDLMSIDIDGNDYWVWKAVTRYHPRVVVGEYNARFGKNLPWIMKYDSEYIWNGSSYYGASLKAFEKLAEEKGYRLVGCNLAGVNAFFIREDLVGDTFEQPFTSEHHYQPQRFFLQVDPVQKPDFGEFESL